MSADGPGDAESPFRIGPVRADPRASPEEARQVAGFAPRRAQFVRERRDAKVPEGFVGAGELEVVEGHDRDTYRAVDPVKPAGAVSVPH